MLSIKTLINIIFIITGVVAVVNSSFAANLETCKSVKEIQRSIPTTNDQPVTVNIGVYIVDIKEIDDVKQKYLTDFAVGYTWIDPRLAFKSDDPDAFCVYPLKEIWHPRLEIINIDRIDKKLEDLAYVN